MKWFDIENALIAFGLLLLSIGLWMTVRWWMFVVLGICLVAFGVLMGLVAANEVNDE